MMLWIQLVAYECAFQEWMTHSGADDPLGWPSEPGYRGLFMRQRGSAFR